MTLNLSPYFKRENIPVAVSTFRSDGEVPVLDSQHFKGSLCHVFKVNFSDEESWAVRIPIATPHNSFIAYVEHEQKVIQELNRVAFWPAPRFIGASLTFDNPVGHPFIVLSWLKGSPLTWSPTSPPRPIRDEVLREITELQLQLIYRTSESMGNATCTEWFERVIGNRLLKVQRGELPEITTEDCFDQKSFLYQVVHPRFDYLPRAMDYGFLMPHNILVDSKHKITGIVGWGLAIKVPILLAGRFPRFLRLPELSLPPSQTLLQDRHVCLDTLSSHHTNIANAMKVIQSEGDVDFRHCYLDSIVNTGTHREMARLGWKLPLKNLGMSVVQLSTEMML